MCITVCGQCDGSNSGKTVDDVSVSTLSFTSNDTSLEGANDTSLQGANDTAHQGTTDQLNLLLLGSNDSLSSAGREGTASASPCWNR